MPRGTTEQTAAIFDEWADRYDTDLHAGTMLMGPLAGYSMSLDVAGGAVARRFGSNTSLLDVGIGTGAFVDRIIQQHPDHRTLKVTGGDPSEGMRSRLKRSHPAVAVNAGECR